MLEREQKYVKYLSQNRGFILGVIWKAYFNIQIVLQAAFREPVSVGLWLPVFSLYTE